MVVVGQKIITNDKVINLLSRGRGQVPSCYPIGCRAVYAGKLVDEDENHTMYITDIEFL